MARKQLGVVALLIGSLVIFALPSGSLGAVDLRQKLVEAGQQLKAGLESTVQKTGEATADVVEKTKTGLKKATSTDADTRATATDPPTQPPAHGTDPHAQGSVAVVDLTPSTDRPLAADPTGKDSGEDVVVGRARGSQDASGAYHGHITIIGLFGNELGGIDTGPGETKNGPLQGLQTSVLDPLCTSTGQQVCLSVLTANSTTSATGSTNDFAIARAKLLGLGVGAAESHGNISQDATCQTSDGSSKTANVAASTGTVAAVANSQSVSKSCRGATPVVTNTSQVIQLGGTGIALPAAGCANGTPDTQSGIPTLLPIICNADEIAGAAGVREALDVFGLELTSNSLLKETTAASESLSVAPAEGGPQCSDGVDNDGDGLVDAADPGCHSDGDATNPTSYVPSDTSEADGSGGNDGSGNGSGSGSGSGSGGGNSGSGSGSGPQCSDNVDNDGDGVIDEDDPGCHSDGDASNPDSFNANDDSEGGGGAGGGGGGSVDSGTLPFTGTDVVGLSLAGLLVLAGGLLLRRREDLRTAR